eukprot:1041527-Amphidinium_carterae.2
MILDRTGSPSITRCVHATLEQLSHILFSSLLTLAFIVPSVDLVLYKSLKGSDALCDSHALPCSQLACS